MSRKPKSLVAYNFYGSIMIIMTIQASIIVEILDLPKEYVVNP